MVMKKASKSSKKTTRKTRAKTGKKKTGKKARTKAVAGVTTKQTAPVKSKRPKKAAAKKAKKATKLRISLGTYDAQELPEERHFFFVNGERVKNVKELAEIMDHIEQEVFDYHVNEERNDFYNWIKHVFDDIELAEKMVGVTGPKHLQFTIYKHVADKAMKKK